MAIDSIKQLRCVAGYSEVPGDGGGNQCLLSMNGVAAYG